jgi:hypothetical protein
MECRMASANPDSPWRCKISIRYEYDDTGKKAVIAFIFYLMSVVAERSIG